MIAREESNYFAETEKRLIEWGQACRDNTEALGMPTMSSVAQMIAHVQAETRRQKVKRKKALRAARKAWKDGDPPIDSKLVAEEFGYVEQEHTAKGKQKRPFEVPSIRLDTSVVQMDMLVGGLANWAKKCLNRSYRYGQPDRYAAREMRMPLAEYTSRRFAAVELVAIKISERYSATARFGNGLP